MRIQVLHLPAPADEWPFVLVFDQCSSSAALALTVEHVTGLKEMTGARGVLYFEATVEVL